MNAKIKTITLIFLISQMLFMVTIPSFAFSNDSLGITDDATVEVPTETQSDNTSGTVDIMSNIIPPELTYTISNPIDLVPGAVRITFDATDIVDYSFEAESLTVYENQILPMTFDLTAIDEFGTFEIVAEKINGDTLNKTVYTYSSGTNIYVSDISKDHAWHICKQYELDSNIITEEDWHREYSILSWTFAETETDCSFENTSEINNALSNGKVVIRGRMTWQTENGNVLPLRSARIELREYAVVTRLLGTTYTDFDGYYCFILDPDEKNILSGFEFDVFIRTCIESETFAVLQPWNEQFNYLDSPVIENITSESGIINVSRRIKNQSSFLPHRLVYIHQGMALGQQFALEMGMIRDKTLYVFYLGNVDFIFRGESPAFCYDILSLIGHAHYKDFYTTVHEYGHYVENRMGNYGSAVKEKLSEILPENFYGISQYITELLGNIQPVMDDYSHSIYENHFSEDNGKQFQMELTWSEAWATAFAEIAISYYHDYYDGISFISDVDYESISNIDIKNSGEAQEYAVTSFLWDLYDENVDPKSEEGGTVDETAVEEFDNIKMTAQEWWDLTTKRETYTLKDLTTNIIDNHHELIDTVGEILSEHQISPKVYIVSNYPCVRSQFTIEWYINGSADHPNDRFKVAFYDEDNNLIAVSKEISSDHSNEYKISYDVSPELWKTIMEYYEPGKEIYAVIYGYRSGEKISGPYFSKRLLVWSDANSHIYRETEYDNVNHWGVCACGVEENPNMHTYSYSNIPSSGKHTASCIECGYIKEENHNYSIVVSPSNSAEGHMGACACGDTSLVPHSGHSYRAVNNFYHYKYCKCGYLIGTVNHTMIEVGRFAHCTVCGHVVDTFSSVTVKGDKEDHESNTE